MAPPPEKRFAAMEQIAHAGTLTGTCMMPILLGAIGIVFEADGMPSASSAQARV